MSKNFEHFIIYYFGLNFAVLQLFLKIHVLSGMANTVDPDQTAPFVALHCLHVNLFDTLVFKILGHLPYTVISCDIDHQMHYCSRRKVKGNCVSCHPQHLGGNSFDHTPHSHEIHVTDLLASFCHR